jgi:hypothetical protein
LNYSHVLRMAELICGTSHTRDPQRHQQLP